jgi:hypothetical protein
MQIDSLTKQLHSWQLNAARDVSQCCLAHWTCLARAADKAFEEQLCLSQALPFPFREGKSAIVLVHAFQRLQQGQLQPQACGALPMVGLGTASPCSRI